ncbi:MAG: hypothetical protein OEM50_10505 [Gammaproteobacteria bacterium]|nr:hypothetical protein [Gammaproteobacteria bacterium]MDH3364098.1 hypothetical protein [Gammaproteobacteria bacterium]MDH3482136.1 hypothetical protein [Gammaproteobacteria bacterium]
MKWWGKYTLTNNRWAHWRVGPFGLFAKPGEREWHVAIWQSTDPQDSSLLMDTGTDSEPDVATYTFFRYAIGSAETELELKPRLGDRPFIVSPEEPLFLLAGQEAVLYVSTIVWIQASVADGDGNVLLDVPTIRRSDTWFGDNTREGELCYSTKTSARTDLTNIQPRPHRAVTPVEIRNEGAGVLPIEQLRVPVPALSLYSDDGDQLWTDAVCFVRQEGHDGAAMTTPEPSAHLPGKRTLIAEPRVPIETGTIVKAFSKLLS